MIKLNEEEEEFCTRAEKYGPQLIAKFKCWNPTNFPICGVTDKYFIIYRGRACLTNPKLLLIFVDRMRDGSVGDVWVLARTFQYYNCCYALENEVTTEVLNEIGDSEKQLASRYKTDSFDLCGATDPFAAYPTVADWLAKVK